MPDSQLLLLAALHVWPVKVILGLFECVLMPLTLLMTGHTKTFGGQP